MSEQWVDIRGLESLYRVSNTGLVASCDIQKGTAGMRARKGRVLKTYISKAGQESIKISACGEIMQFLVSRLVAEHFIRPLLEGECVFHKDLNKSNNNVSNLEIMTKTESCAKTHKILSSFEFVARENMTKEIAEKYLTYRDGKLFHAMRPHMRVNIGDEAGNKNCSGWEINLCGNTYAKNQIVWLMHFGHFPDYVIPKNGDPMDSRIENLFECTASQWATISNRQANLGHE